MIFLLKVQCKEDFSQANFIFPFARRKAMEASISNHCKYALQQQQSSVWLSSSSSWTLWKKKKIAYSDFFNVEFNRETEVEREEVEKRQVEKLAMRVKKKSLLDMTWTSEMSRKFKPQLSSQNNQKTSRLKSEHCVSWTILGL